MVRDLRRVDIRRYDVIFMGRWDVSTRLAHDRKTDMRFLEIHYHKWSARERISPLTWLHAMSNDDRIAYPAQLALSNIVAQFIMRVDAVRRGGY